MRDSCRMRSAVVATLLGAPAMVGCGTRTRAMPIVSKQAAITDHCIEVGRSVEGRPIVLHMIGDGGTAILIMGAFHGDEPTSADTAAALLSHIRRNPELAKGRRIGVIPVVNPDGLARGTRGNARGVDLNRSFPASTWSRRPRGRTFGGDAPGAEPETQAVMTVLDSLRPVRILSIHSIARGRHCVNYDGPGRELAEAMAAGNGYPVRERMGYPTPGSFGTWAGGDRQIPTITLELPRDADAATCWEENRLSLETFLTYGDSARGR